MMNNQNKASHWRIQLDADIKSCVGNICGFGATLTFLSSLQLTCEQGMEESEALGETRLRDWRLHFCRIDSVDPTPR